MELLPETVRRFTLQDIGAMYEAGVLTDEDRIELEDGFLLFIEPPKPQHSGAVSWLNEHFVGARSAWEVRIQDFLMIEDNTGFLSPDVIVIDRLPRDQRPQTARLVIEVAWSSHRRDAQKAMRYARALVHEYWIVDLIEREVIVHRGCRDDVYDAVTRHHDGDTIAAPDGIPPVDVTELLGGPAVSAAPRQA